MGSGKRTPERELGWELGSQHGGWVGSFAAKVKASAACRVSRKITPTSAPPGSF